MRFVEAAIRLNSTESLLDVPREAT